MNMENELLNKLCLNSEAKIESAINKLNESGLKIVLILNSDLKIVGTVSDGDIRRGLLKDSNLQNQVTEIMNNDPIIVNSTFGRESALLLMDTKKIDLIPIVDDEKRLVGLHHKEDVIKAHKRSNVFFIMAGGKGSRLYPQTENCPKPMLEVRGKPILLRIIEAAKKQGFTKFCISIHYLGEVIEEFFGDGSEFGVEIHYLKEEIPLGTAGALGLLIPQPAEAIVVTNGDLITNINYGDMIEFHNSNNAHATMAVREFEIQNQFGVVEMNGLQIVGYEEKPIYRSYINAGVYIINPEVLNLIEPNKHYDMPYIFDELRIKDKKIVAYPIHESWIDVGSPEDFTSANVDKTISVEEIEHDL